jgi:hypothetical protein
MIARDLSQFLFDSSVAIDTVILLAGEHDRTSDAFDDFIDEHTDDELRKILRIDALPDMGADVDDDERREYVIEHVREQNMQGLLVQIASPVKDYADDGNSASYSWGHYHTEWIYTDDLGDGFKAKVTAAVAKFEAADKKHGKRSPSHD